MLRFTSDHLESPLCAQGAAIHLRFAKGYRCDPVAFSWQRGRDGDIVMQTIDPIRGAVGLISM